MTTITNQRPTFCTLFNINNEHLTKDVGLIPYGMHEFEGYDSIIATYINGEYPNLKYTPGLRIEEVQKVSGSWQGDSCRWLIKNAKKIDVLNIYHLRQHSLFQALTYKLFNRSGKIYLKLDGGAGKDSYPLHKIIRLKYLLKLCCLRSTEFKENAERLSKDWKLEIIYVPNPFNPNELQDYRPFCERSNVIFTAGRLGTEQKATEILLEAFAKISAEIPDWKLKLAGPIEGNLNIAKDFYEKYPELKERVIFTGNIEDRAELTELYRDAKIFAFPSRWEGSPLSLSEAILHGEFAVTSNIWPNEFMTEYFKFALGSNVDDVEGFAKNLLYACTHEKEIEQLATHGRETIIKRCNLKRVSNVIAEGLK